MATPEYVVVGHVTRDVTEDGGYRLGGTVTYSGLTALRLGLRVGVLTSAEPGLGLFEGEQAAEVCSKPADATTIFENVYLDGVRRQHLRARAADLTPEDMPPAWGRTGVLHLGPLVQEVSSGLIELHPGTFLGLTPQGWLRRWDERGLVSPVDWPFPPELLALADAVVLSPEDVGHDRRRMGFFRQHTSLLVVTMGQAGAIMCHHGREESVPAYEAVERDPTGAGDVFAAAFFVRLGEVGDPLEAARYANCAASFVVEDVGAANVPTREQVEWRLRHGPSVGSRGRLNRG